MESTKHIDVKELRIGSLIQAPRHKGGDRMVFCYILSITRNATLCDVKFYDPKEPIRSGYAGCEIKEMSGIPITGERLIQMGFENTDEDEYISPFDRKRLILRFNDNGPDQINTYWIEDVGMGEVSLTFDIEFVHQLQNLWFALKSTDYDFKELMPESTQLR